VPIPTLFRWVMLLLNRVDATVELGAADQSAVEIRP